MTLRLPPGIHLEGVPQGAIIAASQWPDLGEAEDSDTDETISAQLKADPDLGDEDD